MIIEERAVVRGKKKNERKVLIKNMLLVQKKSRI